MVCVLGGRLDLALLVLGSPFNFIHMCRLLKYHSKSAFLLLLPWIILTAQALSFPWVIPLGTFMACGFSDLDDEMAAFKSALFSPKPGVKLRPETFLAMKLGSGHIRTLSCGDCLAARGQKGKIWKR